MKIYLAGPLSNWREKVINKLKEYYEIYNPITDSRQQCQSQYSNDDLEATKKCDIILAYQPKDSTPCLALAIEATMGLCNGAIVIYVDERGNPDPIFIGISKRFFSDLDSAIEFLKDFSKNYKNHGIKK
jgi:hypothetical protein